jgi:hypothetical protein
MRVEMDKSNFVTDLENARAKMQQMIGSPINLEDFRAARAVVLECERKVAAERGDEYAESISFPMRWNAGAPSPHLLVNGRNTYLLFDMPDTLLESDMGEQVGLVIFNQCISAKFGSLNEEVLSGHPLFGKGLDSSSVQIIRNSRWLDEVERVNKAHPQYNPSKWRTLNHYIFWFHDETYECLASSFDVEIIAKRMQDAIKEVAERLSYYSHR